MMAAAGTTREEEEEEGEEGGCKVGGWGERGVKGRAGTFGGANLSARIERRHGNAVFADHHRIVR